MHPSAHHIKKLYWDHHHPTSHTQHVRPPAQLTPTPVHLPSTAPHHHPTPTPNPLSPLSSHTSLDSMNHQHHHHLTLDYTGLNQSLLYRWAQSNSTSKCTVRLKTFLSEGCISDWPSARQSRFSRRATSSGLSF